MVFSNTYYFVSAWLLLHVYVLVDVLEFVIVFRQNDGLKYILRVLFCVRVNVATHECFG